MKIIHLVILQKGSMHNCELGLFIYLFIGLVLVGLFLLFIQQL